MSTARSLAAAVRLAGRFFVIGGTGKFGESLSTVERFTPIADVEVGADGVTTGGNWQTMASLLTARRKPAAAVLRGVILVAGENSAEAFCAPVNPNGLGQWTAVRLAQAPRADIFLLSLDSGFLEFCESLRIPSGGVVVIYLN
ncbi:unnamed protein product [Schistocephalus solidus]|uniref:DUF1726 domain-containing protein n=1 Tax=Schistocephalus solidus TaxID=70667 RepID=A0A183TPB6_SCHSO|nr:unnamed protein product [Schistocephalus solidus]